ncbi:MAG: Rrf2 family transcriptional regulator [Patescibacteria group bacterium]
MKTLFRVPMRVHNGLLLMTYLAANHEAGIPISLEEIAEREKISQGFLEEVAGTLRQAGLIEGKRGSKGGYVMTDRPENVTVASIIDAIEGPVALVDCLMDDAACPSEDGCSNRKIWKTVQDRITDTLEGIRLSELVSTKYETTRV